MPSLTKKIVRGKPYYYLRECQRVNGKPQGRLGLEEGLALAICFRRAWVGTARCSRNGC
jgi:hypothetical protein